MAIKTKRVIRVYKYVRLIKYKSYVLYEIYTIRMDVFRLYNMVKIMRSMTF